MQTYEAWGTEVWRGSSAAWQCDEMGHQNARFYVAQGMEGIAELFLQYGLSPYHVEACASVTGHDIRFYRELAPGLPLHLRSAVTEIGEQTALVCQLLFREGTTEVSAAFQTRCAYLEHGRPTAWPTQLRAAMTLCLAKLPEPCQPRGLTTVPAGDIKDRPWQAPAARLTGRGVIRREECGGDGQLLAEHFMSRFSDATRFYSLAFHDAVASAVSDRTAIGSAGVECRVYYFVYPRAGDRFITIGRLSELKPNRRIVDYWMIDPVTNKPWARLESLEVLFDLRARRAFSLSTDALQRLTVLLG